MSMIARFVVCVLMLAAAQFVRAQHIPWILPWNDSTLGTATDFSSLNPPIGTNWVTVDTNAHFTVGGQRIRFLGVNFAGDSPFMPTNNADAVAQRLAKYGVNNVRFHHMDAAWAYQGGVLAYSSTKSTNLHTSNLERLHFLVSRLKARGIYANINLLVGREYRSQDGLGSEITSIADWKDAHILAYFYPFALQLQKDYATKLLSTTNRFTGLPLAKDPAVSFVEIINENGIIQKWLDNGLDKLAARYSTNLQARWNNWLYARYTNDAAMLAAWNVIDQPLGANLLANGSFSNGFTGWGREQHFAARASFITTNEFTSNAPCAKVTVTNADTGSWYIQLNYPGLSLVSNTAYTISYWAKSSPATNASATVMMAHDPYSSLGFGQGVSLTTNWQRFTNTFQASRTDNNARVNFGDMGDKPASFWYADVSLQAGGQIGLLPPGTSLATRTVPNLRHSGTGYFGTRGAQRDWMRFLRDLEYAYYNEMVTHIRSNIGYPGLIFGTIMANSPATVQSRLDVIDCHAYWQHPQFPGTPWDSVNWFLPNISMVNSLSDNTLPGLMGQRIKGKPFVCTEYQHSSPNYYGGEGPLFLAAYAGLQDWDGLWLFDYGHGNPVPGVTMGYVRGFFEIGQHPTKMPNLLLAANLFRRGDVKPALQEYTMALTPETEVDLLANAWAWGIFNASQLGMPGKLGFVSRLSTSVGTNAIGLPTPPASPSGNVVTSDTGELVWDVTQAGAGYFRANTPRTKALVGYVTNRTFNLGGITIRPGNADLGWLTWGMTLKRGEVFTNDCTALIVATGWWENTNQVWKDATKNSVGNQWGGAPVLTEVVPFTLTLPVATNYVRIWALDERGQRKTALPITGSSSSTVISVNTNSASVWYELEISRWTASFDLWRARYFSAQELTNPAISGANAAPDGDRVSNLLKYYLGLPGKTPAPADRLPTGGLLTVTNQQFLSMVIDRDKLALDVTCVPEVSTNLVTWLAGPQYAKTEQITDLGSLERVIFRDLTAVPQATRRFMRLRFTR